MKCSHCGLPLSPTRASCPRCGMASTTSSSKKRQEPATPQYVPMDGAIHTGGTTPARFQQPQDIWSTHPPTPVWHDQLTQEQSVEDKDVPQLPFPDMPFDPNQHVGSNVPQAATPTFIPQTPRQPQYQFSNNTPHNSQPSIGTYRTRTTSSRQRAIDIAKREYRRTVRLGLAMASLCTFTGTLLLIFVFIMSQNLNISTSASENTQSNTVEQVATPTPSQSQVTPTPTKEEFPGQLYIDNARMASSVNEETGQVLQYSSIFQVNQEIFVSFSLRSQNEVGAVCLLWYLNGENVTHYEFDVEGNSYYNGYSYARMDQPGQGYVEIYWASSTACNDSKLLAQRVSFTVVDG